MVRRVFFSFHFDRDNWRSNRVRNSWVTKPSREESGYIDSADWEELKKDGDKAIRRWINSQLVNTSVTVVLIGAETHSRRWVNYEIKRSTEEGKGLLGIRIHNIKNKYGNTDRRGANPLNNHTVRNSYGIEQTASSFYNTYDWVLNSGRNNFGNWVEEAAQLADR